MHNIVVQTTEEQRKAAKDAAHANYEDKKECPDRPGWAWGKCPVSEYYGKVAEIGGALFLGYGIEDLCLYSENKYDYCKPDIDTWDIKAGSSFTTNDLDKGVKRILWVTPWEVPGSDFECGIATCVGGRHRRLSGIVEIRGWTDLADLDLCTNYGRVYKPAGKAMRMADTLIVGAAA